MSTVAQPSSEERAEGARQTRILQMRYLRESGKGVAHIAPPEGSDAMVCCGRSVFEAGPDDTLVDHLSRSTCPDAQPAPEVPALEQDWYR